MKTLKVHYSAIEVTNHSGELFFNHVVEATLPGCRKSVKLSLCPFFMSVTVRPLEGYNGCASIHPEDWRNLVEESPVLSSRLFPCEITPAIAAQAKAEALIICDCPAVRSGKDVHPNYKTSQTWDLLVRRAL
jgi:hypothetical protein